LTAELIAFSNSKSGVIIFGVNGKTGEFNGLSFDDIRHLNQQLITTSSSKVYPPIYSTTETLSVRDNCIVVATIEEGISKPYKDSNGTIYVKTGSDKRKAASNDEIARLLGSGNLRADEWN
jgi:ATP-dependent DNA helicase RecG